MLKHSLFWLVMATLLLMPAGCATKSSAVQAKVGQEFSLAIDQSAIVAGENRTVKFIDVIEDSRCPKGVVCIWAGQVSCTIDFTSKNSTSRVKLTEPGLSDYATQAYEGYQLKFHVEPYPEAGKPIAKSDYRLLLTISK